MTTRKKQPPAPAPRERGRIPSAVERALTFQTHDRGRARLLGAVSLVVLSVILTLGLWPFHSPDNRVKWIGNADGLSFHRYGTVVGSVPFRETNSENSVGFSIEAWVQLEPYRSCSFLSFYNPQHSLQLSIRESISDLELVGYIVKPGPAASSARLYVDDVFGRQRPMFLAITFGNRGTAVYVDGVLAKQAPRLKIPRGAFDGQLILGDSPKHPDGLRGEIRGVAIYDYELLGSQVLDHYDAWKSRGRPKVISDERLSHLYLFNERSGDVVHDQVGGGIDLLIPRKYTVRGKTVLEPLWNEFEVSRSYGSSAIKNIVGFVPVGFCFYLFMLECQSRRPVIRTIISGFLISLTIEVLQIYLPTRDSGTTDLLTNTLGTGLGVLACRAIGISRALK